jgi:hypothetical protein
LLATTHNKFREEDIDQVVGLLLDHGLMFPADPYLPIYQGTLYSDKFVHKGVNLS